MPQATQVLCKVPKAHSQQNPRNISSISLPAGNTSCPKLEPSTPCNTVLLKLTVAQLFKKFTAIYGVLVFITVFTRAHHLLLS
jgi:hypothetical protein